MLCFFVAVIAIGIVFVGCDKEAGDTDNRGTFLQEKEDYYYYDNGKIFLKQNANKILVIFEQSANEAQKRILINNYNSLQLISEMHDAHENILFFAALETKNNEAISLAIMEYFKASPIVVSVTPLSSYPGGFIGLTDEFIVKLKPTTSYKELQKLASQNNCSIKEENPFVKNQYMMSVSKNTTLNAMEMSRLFFETGLFEFSEPNFVTFNINPFG